MANLSKIKRDNMIAFLEELKKTHSDDASIRAFNEIENHLREKKYGLVWEEHSEKVDELLEENIPILTADPDRRLCKDETFPWNFIIEGDNLQALYLLEKTHKGKVDCIYIDPPYNNRNRSWKYNNDYVDNKDTYKHSMWLSLMKTRLMLARRLLNPSNSALIVTIFLFHDAVFHQLRGADDGLQRRFQFVGHIGGKLLTMFFCIYLLGNMLSRIFPICASSPIRTKKMYSSTRENYPARTTPLALITLVIISIFASGNSSSSKQPRCRYSFSSIDFEVTPHILRHTYITNLLLAGVDVKTVQYLAGHERAKITLDIYAHLTYNRPEEILSKVNLAFAER